MPDIPQLLIPSKVGENGSRPSVCLRADLLDAFLHYKRSVFPDSEGVIAVDTKPVERSAVGNVLSEERASKLNNKTYRAKLPLLEHVS